ncbi:hypothetical protein Rhopal_000043-T1 [Rhodotorula paludigena]|uniref:Zn(2)-C6 fungal-type domain-containing protein n=1 Tax=Rhodotorula paludigena TaxID=86838 RepID=A0AAV5GEM6_9BASI|nr:hypothetical protein Rhopal_000043-T1 [Rhodotorula paludigena]
MSFTSDRNYLAEKAEELQIEEAKAPARVAVSKEEMRLVRKIDFIFGPIAYIAYLMTFIDRAAIGNARIAGLEADLGLTGYQFNISLTVFYIFYALFEMPSNIVCKWMGARIWIPLQIFLFGIITLCTAFIQNFGQLIAVRVLLGLAEAGVLPALAFVLSRFYKPDELVLRIAFCVSAAALAGGFGGLLASGFISIGEIGSLGVEWRNIFLFEGLITLVVGVLCACFAVSGPSDAWWLTAEERELAVSRLNRAHEGNATGAKVHGDMRSVLRYLRTPVPWICSFGYLSTNVAVQGVSLFSPTILRSMYPGMSTVAIQLRSVPPYVVAWFWTIGLAYASTRFNRRGIILLIAVPFSIVGYAIFVGTDMADSSARYGGIFLNIMGIPSDAPNYYTGNSMELGFCSFQLLLVIGLLVYIKRENYKRSAGGRDYRLDSKDGIAARAQSALNRLNELIDAEEALVHNRAQKRSAAKQNAAVAGAGGETATRSCSACRRHKSKCVPSDVPDKCVRCIELGKACVYPGVRNRGAGKRLSKNHRALLSIKRDLEAVLAGDDGTDVLDGSSDGEDDGHSYAAGSIAGNDEADTQLLSNPLALLAHSTAGSTSAAARSSTLQRSLIADLTRSETSRAEEPVQAGLLTATDFKRLISLYFTSLRPFMQLLDPQLHTPDWLRLNSPFLATCLAFVSSTFDPLSAHQTEALKIHALELATKIYSAGLKSLEILQAFYVLSHWSPPTSDPSEERAWSWLWDAV